MKVITITILMVIFLTNFTFAEIHSHYHHHSSYQNYTEEEKMGMAIACGVLCIGIGIAGIKSDDEIGEPLGVAFLTLGILAVIGGCVALSDQDKYSQKSYDFMVSKDRIVLAMRY